ncbi:hypothetical protein KEM48_011527 [Puccinia striiformis f. sp. tritici PST-130]|nr:hypothetical protein KEM48_011527 [Puccinia striiformis f. sp. tritici PST-130]
MKSHFVFSNLLGTVYSKLINIHSMSFKISFAAPQLLKDWALEATVKALKWESKYEDCFQMTLPCPYTS